MYEPTPMHMHLGGHLGSDSDPNKPLDNWSRMEGGGQGGGGPWYPNLQTSK